MKYIFVPTFCLLIIILTVFPSPIEAKSFLWKVETKAGDCFLLGSAHMMKKETYPLNPVIENAFDESPILVVEVDLSAEKLMKTGMLMLQHGVFSGKDTLESVLSPEAYKKTVEEMKAMNLDIANFQKFKPWMLASLLLTKKMESLGYDAEEGIDLYFLNRSAGKKEILELEGADFQMSLFEGFSREENEAFLLSALFEAGLIETEMDKLVQAWSNGDADTMERLMLEDLKGGSYGESFYKKIVVDRNLGMVEKIKSYISDGKKFFLVVGAMHMVGENGIVALLKNEGLKVEQL